MRFLHFCLIFLVIFNTACVSNKQSIKNNDPFEPVNRCVYKFNKAVDALYINPVSKIYDKTIPTPAKKIVDNFFGNLNEIPTIFNSILQDQYQQAFASTARFMINSTWGIGGLFDIASKKIKVYKEDFGKTLAVWGCRSSYYLVLPILGPSTIRDGIGFGINMFMTAPYYFNPTWRNYYQLMYTINRRSKLTDTEGFITSMGVDEYTLVKEAYLQNRDYAIYGNNPTKEAKYKNDWLLSAPPE